MAVAQGNVLTDEVRGWVNQRRRGGFKRAEAFTSREVAAAFPSFSKSQVWRVLSALVADGQLSVERDDDDGRVLRYAPTSSWSQR